MGWSGSIARWIFRHVTNIGKRVRKACKLLNMTVAICSILVISRTMIFLFYPHSGLDVQSSEIWDKGRIKFTSCRIDVSGVLGPVFFTRFMRISVTQEPPIKSSIDLCKGKRRKSGSLLIFPIFHHQSSLAVHICCRLRKFSTKNVPSIRRLQPRCRGH